MYMTHLHLQATLQRSDLEAVRHCAWCVLCTPSGGLCTVVPESRPVVQGSESWHALQVDTLDAHGNSLLSEAAAGGSVETCVVLLKLGADPNSQGAFLRTPLWRAAFLGHQSLITPLLEWGCDPRVPNEGGELPVHAASSAAIRGTLGAWDTAQTDSSVAQWRQRREQEQEQAAAAEVQKIQVRSVVLPSLRPKA